MVQEIMSRRMGKVASYLRVLLTPDAYDAMANKAAPLDATFEDLSNDERIALRKAEKMYDDDNSKAGSFGG